MSEEKACTLKTKKGGWSKVLDAIDILTNFTPTEIDDKLVGLVRTLTTAGAKAKAVADQIKDQADEIKEDVEDVIDDIVGNDDDPDNSPAE